MSSLSKLINISTVSAVRNIGIGDGIYVLTGDTSAGGILPDRLGDFAGTNTVLSITTNSTLYNLVGFHPTTANNYLRVSGTGLTMNSVIYANGSFTLVGDPNIGTNGRGMITSTDGINWTSVDSGTTSQIRVVSYAGGRYTYGANAGKVGWSNDGINWASFTQGTGTILSLTYDGNWYFHGPNGSCYRFNGSSYSTVTTNVSSSYSSKIIYANNIWLSADQYFGGIGRSKDLIHWNGISNSFGISSSTRCVSFQNNRTLLLSSSFYCKIASTTDALNGYWQTNTFSTNTSTQENIISGVAYGAGRYVLYQGGAALYSDFLITWSVGTGTSVYTVNKVVYGDKFVAVGAQGWFQTSTNGINWNGGLGAGGTTSTIYSIIYANGIYVYGGAGGALATSTDAITWTARTSGNTGAITAIEYGNGIYMLFDGGVRTSTNAITWTPTSGNRGSYLTYGNGVFVTESSVTTDGITWSSRVGGTMYMSGNGLNLLAYDNINNVFVACTYDGVKLSRDGINWNVGLHASADILDFQYLNNLFIYCGNSGILATSTDTMTWTARTSGTTTALSKLGYYENVYTATLSTGSSVITSTDAITWTIRNFLGTTSSISSFAYGNGKYVYVGFGNIRSSTYDTRSQFAININLQQKITVPTGFVNTGYLQYYIKDVDTPTSELPIGTVLFDYNSSYTLNTSPEYVKAAETVLSQAEFPDLYTRLGTFFTSTWVSRPGLSGMDIHDLIHANNLFVGVGSGIGGNIRTSTDGTTWIARTSASTTSILSVAFGNNTYVYAGNGGQLATSTDAITWTTRTSGTTSSILAVTFGNNTYVYAGNGGMLATSTDAITWTARTSGTTTTIWSLAFGNNLFLFGANSGVLAISTDAVTWNSWGSGTSSSIRTIIYGNGVYVYAGNGGTLGTSIDGTTWTVRTSGTTSTIYKLAFGNNNYIYGGVQGALGRSADYGLTWSVMNSTTTQWLYSAAYGNGTYILSGSGGNTLITSTDLVTKDTGLYNKTTQFVVPKIFTNGYSGNQVYIKAKP